MSASFVKKKMKLSQRDIEQLNMANKLNGAIDLSKKIVQIILKSRKAYNTRVNYVDDDGFH